MKIENLTDKELQDELNRRKEERLKKEKEEREIKLEWAVQFKDELLKMMKHERMSCEIRKNKGYNSHGSACCNKCALEDLTLWDDDVDITFDIRLNRLGSDR